MNRALPTSRSLFDLRDVRSIEGAPTARKIFTGVALLAISPLAFTQGVGFAPSPTAPTGAIPASIEIADFDGDGKPDLATGNSNSNSISVIRNLGGGTFAPQVQYPVGQSPSSLTAADFDADGDVDLAVANFGSQTISILPNLGAGTFGSPTTLVTLAVPQHLTSADVSGDGIPDLVVADYSMARVSVLVGLGTGAFAPEVLYGVGIRPFWVATADLDGDGDVDVSVANSQGRSLSILLNQGGGTFAPQVSIPLTDEISSVATGDLDGDGAIDLVATGADYPASSHTLAVLRNNGNATFAPAVVYATAVGPHSAHCADLNGDGFLDIVDASYGTTANVRLNLGNGTFGPQTQFAAGGTAFCLDVADLDGDGKLDLAVSTLNQNRVVPLLNGGAAPGTSFCFGDGTGTACPCANNGLDGSGCKSSQFAFGASLAGIGTASIAADTVVLTATDTPQTSVLFFQGTTQQSAGAGVVFGDGKRCAGGTATRIGAKSTSAAFARYPEGSDPKISVVGNVTVPGTRTYQGWYRSAVSYCTPATFNLTNGYEIAWTL